MGSEAATRHVRRPVRGTAMRASAIYAPPLLVAAIRTQCGGGAHRGGHLTEIWVERGVCRKRRRERDNYEVRAESIWRTVALERERVRERERKREREKEREINNIVERSKTLSSSSMSRRWKLLSIEEIVDSWWNKVTLVVKYGNYYL